MKIEGAQQTLARFGIMPNEVRESIRREIEKQAINLQRHIVQDKLSGNPLHRRTGDLSRSVYYKVLDSGLTGQVGANTPYAARQEYGFTGTETVRSFVRRSRAQMKEAKRSKSGRETRASLASARGTGDTVVRSFSRHVNYPAHSYLRSAFEDLRAEIIASIQAAGKRGVAK